MRVRPFKTIDLLRNVLVRHFQCVWAFKVLQEDAQLKLFKLRNPDFLYLANSVNNIKVSNITGILMDTETFTYYTKKLSFQTVMVIF